MKYLKNTRRLPTRFCRAGELLKSATSGWSDFLRRDSSRDILEKNVLSLTRRQALLLCAAPAFAQSRPRVAITMDDVRWQNIPEAQRSGAEERLLAGAHGTRAFLFAVGQAVDNEHGSEVLKNWSAAGHLIGNHTYEHIPLTDIGTEP